MSSVLPNEPQVLERLATVYDPELGLSLVDLGLIYDVGVQGRRVDIVMTLTTQGCPMHDALLPAVEAAVRAVPFVEEVCVQLVWEPPWSVNRMTPEAAEALGLW